MSQVSVENIPMENGTPSRKDSAKASSQGGGKKSTTNCPVMSHDEEMCKDMGIDYHDGLNIEEIKAKLPCTNSRWCKVLVILVLLGLDTADLISDWLLYIDVSIVEQGLVYGPPEESEIIALLFFSIVGTLTFIFEAVNIGRELFRKKPWFDVDLVSAVTIWIEDVPQIVINVFIALCREDPISVFQLTKASIILFGILIRIVISFVRYTNKRALIDLKVHTAESVRHVTYRVLIILGLLVNFGCAIAVFVFTQTQRDPDGNLHFQIPKTIFEDRFNDERYFHNVSVYLHHSSFEAASSYPTDVNDAGWMRLISINSIRNQPDKQILFKYEYQETPTQVKMALWDDGGNGWQAKECYTLDKTGSKSITDGGASCSSFLSGARTSVIIKFAFEAPDSFFRRLIFGDIRYNAKVNDTNGACSSVTNMAQTLPEGLQGNNAPVIHYYRTMASEADHLLRSGPSPRFYNSSDLEDITIVWRTGWKYCQTTGSLAPHVTDAIDTPCT